MATIYVYLLNEGTDVWRPVEAEALGSDRYRITSRNLDPEEEQWQFSTDDIVRCEVRRQSDREFLVAVQKE